MPIPHTAVVIPCYNESERLDVEQFDEFATQWPDVGFLFMDDGSTDNTAHVLNGLQKKYPHRFSVYRLPSNVGKAEAVRQGMIEACRFRPKFAGYWDADLATPLDAITQFRSVLEAQEQVHLVMGSRVVLLGRQVERRRRRHVIGRTFATLVSWMLEIAVYDTQCGAKLFRVTPEIQTLFDKPFHSRWIFDVEILARLIRLSDAETLPPVSEIVHELPLDQWHDVGGSKLRPRDFVRAMFELMAIYRKYVAGTQTEKRVVDDRLEFPTPVLPLYQSTTHQSPTPQTESQRHEQPRKAA